MVESIAEYVPAVLVLDSIDISQIIPLELTFPLVLNTKFLSLLTAVKTPLPLPGSINTSFNSQVPVKEPPSFFLHEVNKLKITKIANDIFMRFNQLMF